MIFKKSPSSFLRVLEGSTFRAGITNTFLGFFSKVLSYLTYAIVAYIFGSQRQTDIYYLGLSFSGICSGIVTIVVISVFSPILIKIRIKHSVIEARQFAGSVLLYLMIFSFAVSLLTLLYPIGTFKLVSHFPIESLQENRSMLLWFSAIIFLTITTEFGRVYIQSMGKFSVIALITVVQSSVLVVGIVAMAGLFQINALVLSMIFSLAVQCLLVFIFCLKENILPIVSMEWTLYHKELVKVSTPLVFAHIVTLFAGYYLDYSASGLSAGILTGIVFAQRLYMLPVLVLFNPVLEIINTKFSEYFHQDGNLLQNKFIEAQRIFFFFLTPVMVLFILFRKELVTIFFVRGSFTDSDALITINCLAIYSITIVSNCFLQICSRIYFTMQKTGWTSFWGSIGFIILIIATYVSVRRYGYLGIPLSKVSVELFYFIPVALLLVRRYLGTLRLAELSKALLILIVISVSIGGSLYWVITPYSVFILSGIIKSRFVYTTINLFLISIVFVVLYVLILHKIKFKEMIMIEDRISCLWSKVIA